MVKIQKVFSIILKVLFFYFNLIQPSFQDILYNFLHILIQFLLNINEFHFLFLNEEYFLKEIIK